ncbi:MAG: hypothetical protein JNK38_17795 [Acidobacteria bacterium]|nr:hypothetical protein [Acidobacteriota bacterium]
MMTESVIERDDEQALKLSDEQAAQLHHRFALGEELSDGEQNALQHWYEMQDRLEAEQLGIAMRRHSISELERRIQAIAQQLSETIRLNNEIAAHNSAMISELAALKNALPSSQIAQ